MTDYLEWAKTNGQLVRYGRTRGGVIAPPDDDGFVLRETKPDANWTGFRVPELSLTAQAGTLTATSAPIIQRNVQGSILVPNSVSEGFATDTLIRLSGMPQQGEQIGLEQMGGDTQLFRMEHSTVRVAPEDRTYFITAGAQGRAISLYRCDISGVIDGFDPSEIAGVRGFGEALGCYIHDLPHYDYDGGRHADGSHNDGIQAAGGLDHLWIIGCAIEAGYTGGVLLTNDRGANPAYTNGGLIIEDNWFSVGDPLAGSLLNMTHTLDFPGASIKRNRFNLVDYPSKAAILIKRSTLDGLVASGGIALDGPDANVMVDDDDNIVSYVRYFTENGLYPTAGEAVYP